MSNEKSGTRKGDFCTGHGAFPPRVSTQGSSNVFINTLPANRQGDSWASHCAGSSCHVSTTQGGSGTVFINSKPAVRIGDKVACGSVVATGSYNVFIGD